jgi:hypothetical protein
MTYDPKGPFIDQPQVGFARLLMITPDTGDTGVPFSRYLPVNQAVQWARDMNENRPSISRLITFRIVR